MERSNGNFDPSPKKYVPPFNTIDLGNVDVDSDLDEHRNESKEPQGNIESRFLDHPHQNREQTQAKELIQNGEQTQAKVLIKNQDSKYAKCRILDRPDDMLMKTPISKICIYFDEQFAIFDNTDHFTTVNRHTFAIKNAINLRASDLASNSLAVLDANSNYQATVVEGRHLYYALYDAVKCQTTVVTHDGKLLTDIAKSCFMAWNDAAGVFEIKTGVARRVMNVNVVGSVWMLTDEGLAFYHIDDIKASTGDVINRRSAIALVKAEHCLQAFTVYAAADNAIGFLVLTDKGAIQYVKLSKIDGKLSITNTTQMVESLKSNTVFSAITFIWSRKPPVVVVAGFDVDRQVNMMIVLNGKGARQSKLDAISNGDCLPIIEINGYLDEKLDISLIISWSIRSVYVHCLDAKYKMTHIFDHLTDGLVIYGINIVRSDGDYITLTVYGQRDTRGDIVRLRLEWDADEISKLK